MGNPARDNIDISLIQQCELILSMVKKTEISRYDKVRIFQLLYEVQDIMSLQFDDKDLLALHETLDGVFVVANEDNDEE